MLISNLKVQLDKTDEISKRFRVSQIEIICIPEMVFANKAWLRPDEEQEKLKCLLLQSKNSNAYSLGE